MDSQEESVCSGCGRAIPESSSKCYDCAVEDANKAREAADTDEIENEDKQSTTDTTEKPSLLLRTMNSLNPSGVLMSIILSLSYGQDEESPGPLGILLLLLFIPMIRQLIEEKLGIELSGWRFWVFTVTLFSIGYIGLSAI